MSLWTLAAILVALVLGKTYVADLYRVKSGSMEPTLFGGDARGETVLVRFDRSPELKRFDLVIVERPGRSEPVVKRVVGLPGETISISAGDLVVDGSRLSWDAQRPTFVEVFNDAWTSLEDSFWFKRGEDSPWTPELESAEPGAPMTQTWSVDARDVVAGSNAGMMLYSPDLRDEYRGPAGERCGGVNQVGDGVLDIEVAAPASAGRVRFMLVEEGDTFDAFLDWGPDGATRVTFERWMADRPAEVIAEAAVSLPADSWHRLRFRNVDNSLVLEVFADAVWQPLLVHAYEANQEYHGVVRGNDRSVGARVGFGAEGGRARFRAVRIARDLHYLDQGEFAVSAPLTLGLDEVFLLGDNSVDSRDGRFWGPVPTRSILGRPVAVVRPWERRRILGGVADELARGRGTP